MIIEYVRYEDRTPFGCFVSDGPERAGWSFCSPLDKFDKKIAINIAKGRCKNSTTAATELLLKVKGYQGEFPFLGDAEIDAFVTFTERANRYWTGGKNV